MRARPMLSVTVAVVNPVAGLLAVTVAPGTTWRVWSTTMSSSVASAIWALAAWGASASQARAKARRPRERGSQVRIESSRKIPDGRFVFAHYRTIVRHVKGIVRIVPRAFENGDARRRRRIPALAASRAGVRCAHGNDTIHPRRRRARVRDRRRDR